MSSTTQTHAWIALSPAPIGQQLAQEVLELLGEQPADVSEGLIEFNAKLEQAYKFLLHSRLAGRVGLTILSTEVTSIQEIKEQVSELTWQDHLHPDQAVEVRCLFSKAHQASLNTFKIGKQLSTIIQNTLTWSTTKNPWKQSLEILVFYYENQLRIAIDCAGGLLSQRGYRLKQTQASLKEQLAAAIISKYPPQPEHAWVLDPMCGAGTLLIEAATQWAGIAPNLERPRFGIEAWPGHDSRLYQRIIENAVAFREAQLQAPWPDFIGYDADPNAIQAALANAKLAGLEKKLHFERKSLFQLPITPLNERGCGYVIVNPPYGERLGDGQALMHLYRFLGQQVQPLNAYCIVMSSNIDCLDALKLNYQQQHRYQNGPLPLFVRYGLASEKSVRPPSIRLAPRLSSTAQADTNDIIPDLANRLHKNYRKLKAWLDNPAIDAEPINSYRLYDADLPEYNFAIDCYEHCVHVQEYKPPKHIQAKAQQRLEAALGTIARVLNAPKHRITLKTRARQSGSNQYNRSNRSDHLFPIRESGANVLVNLKDFLDTGVFLDHRLLRLQLKQTAYNTNFLNLYAYTGTASLQAALGGARRTTSVDLSENYLNWARRNFYANGISDVHHQFIQSDALVYLTQTKERYDLIFIDPPTFSNSKKTKDFSVQEDHSRLIELAMKRLTPAGRLLFSTNFRQFKMSPELFDRFNGEEITHLTTSPDYARTQGRGSKGAHHRCWQFGQFAN